MALITTRTMRHVYSSLLCAMSRLNICSSSLLKNACIGSWMLRMIPFQDDDCIGDDYADDDWESSYDSSEGAGNDGLWNLAPCETSVIFGAADSDNYCQLWPDPFEEGTEAWVGDSIQLCIRARLAGLQRPEAGLLRTLATVGVHVVTGRLHHRWLGKRSCRHQGPQVSSRPVNGKRL